ncbi:MAG: thiamine-phosphate [Desulfobulbaceae bacterium]|jgi:thiamine-phosphate pyrophosphorylase|nr:MAG: thiamine-phosphate [Desulfobulbaceae bacterium]
MVLDNVVRGLYDVRLQQFLDEVTLYPVSCERLAGGRSDREWLNEVLAGGARIVQLRDKESADGEILAKARYFREKTREAGALFLVNDRVDIALLSDADGVHVGQNDLPPEEIRKLAPDFLIGLSCNTLEQVRKLGDMVRKGISPASYFNIGPLYATSTKHGLKDYLGAQAIHLFTKECSLPFTVMGGIKADRIEELCAVGVKRMAVVTALSQAPDIAMETTVWITKMKECSDKRRKDNATFQK